MALNLPKSEYYQERVFPDWRDRFTINWLLTTKCNFKCEYCIPQGSSVEDFDLDKFLSELKKLVPVRVVITGGEPLLVPNMIKICQEIGKIGIIEMQTNFSVKAKEFVDSLSPEYVELIRTTWHPQERTGNCTTEAFIDNLLYAKSKGYNVSVFIVDYPKMYTADKFLEYCKVLHDVGITPVRKRYCGDACGGFIGDTLWMKGKRCYSGYKGIMIMGDFTVHVCDADRRDLGNFLAGYKLFDKPIVCEKEFAGCMCREFACEDFYDKDYDCQRNFSKYNKQ